MEINDNDESNNNTTKSRDEEVKVIYDRMVESVNHSMFREISRSASSFSRERSIYVVPKLLRNRNPKAYSPQVISIGPLHYLRIQNDLIKEKKGSYVLNFLTVAKLDWSEMINKFLSWEERARNYYVETIKMERVEFIQLLIYDSCFVVMYIIGSMAAEFRDLDTSFLWRFSNGIFKDLLLLENQLPFFLLHHLYNLCASAQPSLKDISFTELLRGYFSKVREGMSYVNEGYFDIADASDVNHLVDFLRVHLTQRRHIPHFLGFSDDDFFSSWPLTATELHDCGVSFHGQRRCMMDVSFKERSGVLRMPKIIIDDSFEILFRNMIAYEYCHLKSRNASNFGMFMRFLINTNKDVSLLVDDGIIQNHLGSTKEIVVLFDDLCKNIMIERNFYSIDCWRMKEYCKHRRHRWMTSLKRDYFGTPWAFISFVAAVLLLILTLLQTVVAFIALYK